MIFLFTDMDENDLIKIKNEAAAALDSAADSESLEAATQSFLGKEGKLSLVFRSFGSLAPETRSAMGFRANKIKQELEDLADAKRIEIETKFGKKESDWVDVTLPAAKLEIGHIHPLTQTIDRIVEIFHGMGFEIFNGPEVENEWYAFDALNIPQDHPTRDNWDTLYVSDKQLLRPHTSPGQIRYMENHQPPLRIILPGRCYRRDAIDASHEVNFYQVEGLMVDKKISVANFKGIIEEFFKQFFSNTEKDGDKLSCGVRLRPSYFPFTEPSFEVDLACVNCGQKGCSACKGTGWMEIMGAGMVHPNVFANAGVDASIWRGFAFGMGVERLAMIRHKINDIRLFYDGGQTFLEQF